MVQFNFSLILESSQSFLERYECSLQKHLKRKFVFSLVYILSSLFQKKMTKNIEERSTYSSSKSLFRINWHFINSLFPNSMFGHLKVCLNLSSEYKHFWDFFLLVYIIHLESFDTLYFLLFFLNKVSNKCFCVL